MMSNLEPELEYDDVLILPKISSITSRENVSLQTTLGKSLTLDLPIICSPMKWISNTHLITELGKLGGLGILHRFYDSEQEWFSDIEKLDSIPYLQYGISIGLGGDYKKLLTLYQPNVLCVDIANGYLTSLHSFIYEISTFIANNNLRTELMAGNVVDSYGADRLYDCGATIVRVGIGSGNLCTTRLNTGVGRPQLSALLDVSNCDVSIVADGGIKSSGDIVKALAAGADAVLIGSMFATVFESDHDGQISGMASRELQENFYGYTKSVEGVTKEAKKTVSLRDFITEISYNIRSGFTYVNARDITDLHFNARFIVKSR